MDWPLPWAGRKETLRSYELFSHYVAPVFQGQRDTAVSSRDWASDNRETFVGGAITAVMKAIQNHAEEKAERAARS